MWLLFWNHVCFFSVVHNQIRTAVNSIEHSMRNMSWHYNFCSNKFWGKSCGSRITLGSHFWRKKQSLLILCNVTTNTVTWHLKIRKNCNFTPSVTIHTKKNITVTFWELWLAVFLCKVSVTLKMSLGVNYYKEQVQKKKKEKKRTKKCKHIFL